MRTNDTRYPVQVTFAWGGTLFDKGAPPPVYRSKTSPWVSQPAEYEAMLNWVDIYEVTPLEDYKTWKRGELIDRLGEWHKIHTAVFYYNNRYSIARIAPLAEKHISAITHQLWRLTQKPMWRGRRAKRPEGLKAADVKARVDARRIYEKYGHLQKFGINFKTICPWHTDHDPSLVIRSSDWSCHCYVCQKGGDVLSYLQQQEKGHKFYEILGIALELGS